MLHQWRAPGWRGHGLALLLGLLGVFAFAPYGFWPALILSGLGLLWSTRGLTPKAAFARGFFWALGFYGFGVSWVHVSIHVFGQAPWVLAAGFVLLLAAYMALYAGLAMAALARWFPKDDAARHVLAFPVLWLAQEAFRGWFITGFPWLFFGYSQIDGPLAGLAPVLGVYGLSLGLAMVIGALYLCLSGRYAFAALAAAVLALGWAAGRLSWVAPKGAPVSLALVQGNVPQEVKWNPESLEPTVETYAGLSAPHWGRAIVVWPEAALPALREQLKPLLDELDKKAQASGSALVMGLPTAELNPRRYHNSVVVYGRGEGEYHKQHLVPFGEYVPLEAALRGLIGFFDLPMSAFTAGESGAALKSGGITLNPAICYEIAYPLQVAAVDADAILTVSNDAWFGDSIGPHQHLEIARMRALENGRPLIRATNNGITALVDAQGRVTARLPQFEPGVLSGEIQPTTGRTPFARFGAGLLAGLAALMLGLAWWRRAD
ncbi:MAG: apolipoprotein N-acyltransferase [Gammaproteobacteria bacterium]|nr:apolipoprotein N-acyltransferase [Gammaproteobacteria bacterium]